MYEDKAKMISVWNLVWIVPLFFAIGLGMGFIFAFPEKLVIDYSEDVVASMELVNSISETQNNALWACRDGCLYSDWQVYGRKNRTDASPMYINCSGSCWQRYNPER